MRAREEFAGFQFSDRLCDFIDANPEFRDSLRISHPREFLGIKSLILSGQPEGKPHSADQVIGIIYLDLNNLARHRRPLFKQDFIVNVDSKSEKFVLYCPVKESRGISVRRLSEFVGKYGANRRFYFKDGGKGKAEHHYDDVADLPEPLRVEGQRLKEKALRMIDSENGTADVQAM